MAFNSFWYLWLKNKQRIAKRKQHKYCRSHDKQSPALHQHSQRIGRRLRMGKKEKRYCRRVLKVTESSGSTHFFLPQDIIANILSRLPVKSLIRFRCVSKLWCSLTYEPYFQHEQHKRAMAKRTCLVLGNYYGRFYSFELLMYSFDQAKMEIKDSSFAIDLDEDRRTRFIFWNSVNGLIRASQDCLPNSNFYLMNPATREAMELPMDCEEGRGTISLALAFDVYTEEYKVVRMFFRFGGDLCLHSEILTLGSQECWRYLGKVPCIVADEPAVFLNGSLHWIGFIGDDGNGDYEQSIILTLDMKHEKYGFISTPGCRHLNTRVLIQNSGGNLLYLAFEQHVRPRRLRIWVTKDYTSREWTKTYDIEVQDPSFLLREPAVYIGVAYDKVLLYVLESDMRMFYCYDLQEKTFQKVYHGACGRFIYTESLVSPRKVLVDKSP